MNSKKFKVEDLFTVQTGDYHATKELEPGDIPLISCGDSNNGLVGYYDIPDDNIYSDTITVAYNGQPLTAKFHPYSFGAKDDVAVLLPKTELNEKTLIYIAAVFNKERWRYSYGRKCFKSKFQTVEIPLPVAEDGELDEEQIAKILEPVGADLPEKRETEPVPTEPVRWEKFQVTEFFDIQRGDFHALSKLDEGDMPTVSRVTEDNGIVDYYEPPEDAEIYEPYKITVSSVSGKAFVQVNPFIATDNVVILTPKEEMDLTTIFFFQLMIDNVRWRYSYGRQCYKTKFAETEVYLPLDASDKLDKPYMRQIIENTSYWGYLEDQTVGATA